MSDVLYNRVKAFFVEVPDDFDIEKDIQKIQDSVKKSLSYLYNMLLDRYYLKTFKYEIKKYYKVSNIVEVNLVDNDNINNNTFCVNIKENL